MGQITHSQTVRSQAACCHPCLTGRSSVLSLPFEMFTSGYETWASERHQSLRVSIGAHEEWG